MRGNDMKVLSIKEPFATLIMNGSKKIETKGKKTNYRGELYIHASKGKIIYKKYLNRPELLDIIEGMDMNYGYIICKCNLVDCIYMDEDFINNIKKNKQEYLLGYYEVGRYAWILDNIEIIKPIPAKGRLNIWQFNKND